jgi:hypothetical protein
LTDGSWSIGDYGITVTTTVPRRTVITLMGVDPEIAVEDDAFA